jgi:valyl-tRNA synthetase
MAIRYDNWVEGLAGDWLVSRQRYFGVPFPIWYSLDAEGQPDYDHPITAEEASLPVDPASECPPGYDETQRGQAGGFIGDPDVMDTWATSSLSPQVAGRWSTDDDLFGRVFPMDLRPQAHDIIRTWLFATVVRSHLEHNQLPWANAAISGFVVGAKGGDKISKSKGNATIGPNEIIDQHGADAVRWRAASASPGTDTPFDEAQMKVGRRLAIKILNASKFALRVDEENGLPASSDLAAVTEPVDLALLAALRTVVEQATTHLNGYDYTRALVATETFFWAFCDDYVELVKERAYGGHGAAEAASARAALGTTLSVLLRLFAPYVPYVTEEVWSWWQEGSVHRASWPTAEELTTTAAGDPALIALVGPVLSQIRGAKSTAQVSMRTEVSRAVIKAPSADLELLRHVVGDLQAAGRITTLDLEATESAETTVDVTM